MRPIVGVATVDLSHYNLTEWTPIATQGRLGWQTIVGSPLTAYQARSLHDAGRLLMAQRRTRAGMIELVVKETTR